MSKTEKTKHHWPIFILLILVTGGIVAEYFSLIDWQSARDWAQNNRRQLWLPILLVVIQILLYMFALPGSGVLWLVAPVYEPVIATCIIVSGASLGALAAFWFARTAIFSHLEKIRQYRIYGLLSRRSDFWILLSLRLLPGFPHSIINYSAGILHLPLPSFFLSTMIGIGIKTYLYTSVIYEAVNEADQFMFMQLEFLGLLMLMALLTILVRLLWFGKK